MVDPLAIYLKLAAKSGQWLAALHALHAAKIVLSEPPALLNTVPLPLTSSISSSIANKKLINTNIANEMDENHKNCEEYKKIIPSENVVKLTKCFSKSNANTIINAQNTASTDKYSERSQEDKLLSEESVLLLTQTMLDTHKWQLALQVARLPISFVTSSKDVSDAGDGGVTSDSEMEQSRINDRKTTLRSWSAYKLAIESIMNVMSATTTKKTTETEPMTSANKEERQNVENAIADKDIESNVAFMICEAARVCNLTSTSQYKELLQLIEIMMQSKRNDSAMQESLQNTKTYITKWMETQSTKAKEEKSSNKVISQVKENETSKPQEIYELSNTNNSFSDINNQIKSENVDSITKSNNNNDVDKNETEAVKEKMQQQQMLRMQLCRLVKSSQSEIWKRALQLWQELTSPSNSDLQNVCVILTKARRERELTDLIRLYLTHIDNNTIENNHQDVECTSISKTYTYPEKWKCVYLNHNLIKLFAESALQLRSRALAMLLLHSTCINSLLLPSSAVPIVEVLKQCREEKVVIEWWNKLPKSGLPKYCENNNRLYFDEFQSSSSQYDAKSKRNNVSVTPLALREHIKLCSYVATCIALIARRAGLSTFSSSDACVWEEILLTFQYSAKYNPSLAVLFALRSLRITQSWEPAIWLYTAYLHKCAKCNNAKKIFLSQELYRCEEEEEKWHETCERVILDDISADNSSSNVSVSNNKQKDKIWNIFFANCECQINERTDREIQRIFHDENPTQWIPAKVLTRLYKQEQILQSNEKRKY